MTRHLALYVVALSFVLGVTATALAGDPTFTTIDFPGARMTNPVDVNAPGEIVGEYTDAAGKAHGFLLSHGAFTSIDFPGAVLTSALGINPRGDIVGRYQTSDGHFHGFLLSRGTFRSIDVGQTLTRAHGINARGDIVGRYDDPDGRRHGFLLSEGEFTSIDVPGALDTAPWGINSEGDITGRYSSADGKSHGFLLSEGDFTTIDVPGAVETAPAGGVNGSATVRINPRGDIVGTYCAAEPCSVTQLHGFLLSKGKGNDEGDNDSTDDGTFTSFDFPGAIGTLGTGINPRGDIVGIYFDKSGRRHGFLLSRGDDDDANDQLVLHVVAPRATDPAIDRALDNHYVWLDPAARTNHRLLVFMPGFTAAPADYQLVQKEAARLGYHVIGLMYVNTVRLVGVCPFTADPDACWENAHLEMLDGIDRTSVVDVNEPNSIDNRLTKLLQYLTARYPEEGWSRFLAHGAPKWSRIAISGHSLGGAQAAMIAKLRVVARVVLFSSVPDKGHTTLAIPWTATHVTPAARYWGLAHDRDPVFPSIRANWDSLGMGVFGAAVAPETSEPPYDFTHMLVTDLVPQGGSFSVAHGSTVGDNPTPRGADGAPVLRDAWRYLLTARTVDDDDADEDDGDDARIERR